MRICIVSEEYPPITSYYGGIGTEYGRIAPALVALGHDVHVVTQVVDDETEEVHEVAGVKVHPLRRGRAWPWSGLARTRAVSACLAGLGSFDAVVAPEFRGEALHYSRRQPQGPLITHLLTSTAQLREIRPGLTPLERHGLRTQLTLLAERQQAERSTALLAPGSAVLRSAGAIWDLQGRPARISPLSVDVDHVRRSASGELPDGFPHERPVVTFASRLDGHKGAQHLVAAMASVWERWPEAQLAFVGRDARWRRGWMSDHLRDLAGERADRVHTLGFQPDAEYFAAVAASDVVAIPSLWESFCIAGIEAMALRRPLIGTTGNGFSEFVRDGENGLLVRRGDIPALAAALLRLLEDDQLRATLGSAAAATADRHRPEHVARLYADAVNELLAAAAR